MSAKKGNQMAQLSAELKSLKQAVASSARKSNPKKSKKSKMASGSSMQMGSSAAVRFPSGKVVRKDTTFRTKRETEYIGEVAGSNSTTPVVQSYSVNPGQSTTFPLLASIAKLYEKYRFVDIEFFYKPEVSQYATGGQTGKVILAIDYDASDAPPTTKAQVEDTDVHCDSMGWQECRLRVPSKSSDDYTRFRYVRPGGLPGSTDIKTYDLANLNVVTVNNGSTGNIGELWVTYICEFDVRINENTSSAPTNLRISSFYDSGALSLTSTVLGTQLLAGTAAANGYANPGAFTLASGVLTCVTPGNYLLNATVGYNIGAGGVDDTALRANFYYNNAGILAAGAGVIAGSALDDSFYTFTMNSFIPMKVGDTISVGSTATFSASTVTSVVLGFTLVAM